MRNLNLLAIALLVSFCAHATVAPITGVSSVCVGATTTLSNATTGGSWSCTSVNATVDAASGVVTGTSAGTATVSYTVGADVATTMVTVAADPGTIHDHTPICVGVANFLWISASGGTWSSSNPAVCSFTGTAGDFTSTSSGTSSITYTLPGCTVTKVITVDPVPAPITGPTSFCLGSATTLSNATPGGSWIGGYPSAAVGSATGIVTGVGVGTATIYYRMPTGCYTYTGVSVVSASSTITGGSSLCIGVPATLSFAATGGTWASDASSTAGIDPATGVVTGLVAGTAGITYTSPGCAPASITVTVTSTLPSISGAEAVCYYIPTTLSNSMGGGTWTSSNTAVATIGSSTGVVSSVSAGTSMITYNTGSCGYATKIVTAVGVMPAPTTTAGFICGGTPVTLSNTMAGGTWSSNTPAIAAVGSATGIVTAVSPGYAYLYYNVLGCRTGISIRVYSTSTPQLVGCNYVSIGDTIKFLHPFYSTWTSSNSAVATVNGTGRVTGVSSGTAIITNYSPYVGCIQGVKTVSVTATPLIRQVSGFNLICANASTTLTDAIPGGVWSCSPSSVMAVNPSTGVVSGVSGGQGTITYTNGAASCTFDFYVNAAPPPISGPSSVCLHETVTLSSSFSITPRWGFPGANFNPGNDCNPDVYYTWGYPPPIMFDCGYYTPIARFSSSNPAVASVGLTTGAVVGASVGGTTITYSDDATHCIVTTPVTVNPISVGPITGTLTTCIGSTATLSNSVTGGTWTSGNTSIATIGSSTGFLYGVAAGTVSITYSDGTSCGRSYAVATVSPVPGAISGSPATLCVGSSATLSNSTTGGTWSSSASTVVSVMAGTGVIAAVGAGSAVITYTLGPCGNYTTTTISVNTSFPVTGTANICDGATTTFSNAGGSGTWTSSDVAIATVGTTGIVTAIDAGTAVITFTSATCGSTTKMVTVYPVSPITGPTNVCIGTPAMLGNATPGGTWASAYTIATIDAGGTVTGVATGVTPITYTLPTGCRAIRSVTISVSPTSYSVTGGGAYCTGGAGVPVYLSNSRPDVSYQLYRGSTAMGAAVTGTYSSLNFGLQTVTGSYYVLATGSTTGCAAVMTGTVNVTTVSSVPAITGTPIACIGAGATVLSNAMSGGTWSSSNTSVATVSSTYGYVYAAALGTSIISYTTPACGTATVVVMVNNLPPVITGVTAVCQGYTTTLSIAATGGTWSSGNTAWATVDPSGVVTGILPSYASIQYTATTGCTRGVIVTVSQTPVLSGPSTLCVGGSATLSAGGVGGTWSSSDASIVSVDSWLAMSGVALGTATITYVTPAGCYDTHTVNVTASCSGMPVAGTVSSGAGVVCAGTPVVLTLSGSTVACGISYQWQNSPDGTTWTNISGVTNTSLTDYPSATTYYRCAVTCASGGLTAYSTVASVVISYAIASHSIVPGPDTACNNAHFRLTMCSYASSLNVTTYYGDGSSDNVPVTYSSGIAADVFHNYTLPGTYTIKQVLYDGAAPQDSVTFAYEHLFCRTLPIKFYQDFNTNCAFDAGDNYNTTPVTMAVDSNGVTIDTIIVTSGMYRKAYGPPGTIYAFRVLAVSGGRVVACPSSAVLYDTISATVYTYPEKYFGIQCGSSTSFDLAENVTTFCGTTFASSTIYISNSYCTPASPVVTMHMSPRYHFLHATPAPASVSGNTITWNLPPVSTAAIPMRTISVVFVPTVTLVPGDTIHSDYQVTPLSGDVNTANNYIAMVNTIVTSYDPNDLEVSPAGKVLPCAQLQYRVRFENTGNDTARNIYVLDTLSPNIDPMSLNVVMASAAMNVSVINDGVRNIARFDFPHINLLDSSHHNQCQGMFIFSVKARSGLTFGSVINNKVGIYFDDNAVVGTNTVSNTIGMDTIAGPGIVCSGSSITLSNATTGGTWSITGSGAGIAGGVVTGISAGTATVSYTIANGCGSFRVTKIITVNSTPSGAAISGTATVCVGNTTSLSGTVAGGTWTSSNSSMAAVGSSGVVSGIASGNATISYAIANSCGSTVVTRVVTVNTLPSIAAISGMSSVCVGAVTTLYDITSGGVWSSTNTGVATMGAAGVVSGIAAGSTTISYTTGNACGMSAATVIITVNTPPSAGTISGSGVICPGAAATLSSAVPGGTWGSTNLSIATVSAGGVVSAVATGYVAITYTVVNSCGSASAMTIVTVNTSAASPIAGSLHLCTGTASGLSNAVPGGTWSSSNVAVATIGSVTGLATGLTTGTTTITYTQAGGCRITAVATVGLNPAAITGLTEVCSGRTITLANTVAGGIWSSSATSIAGIGSSSGIVTGVTSGTAMMTYTMPGGCASSAILSVLSSVMPAATVAASPAGPVCVGVPVSFSAIPVYGGSAPLLSWIVNGATAGAGTSYSYTPADGDHVVCRLISSMQCRIADTVFSDPASLEVYPAYTPVVTIATDPGIYVFPAQTVTLTALAVDAGVAPQYQWLLNGVVIPGATLVSYTSSSYSDKDSITCMVTGTGGCGIIGYKSVVMHVFPLSVSNTTTGTNIDIHPNPTSGMLTISGTVNNGADQEVAIEVTNMLGQVVYKRYITTKNDVVYEQVELSNTLPNGMYMLSLKTVGGSKVVHFVLEQK